MSYLRKRIVQALVTFYSIITLGFFFIQMMPGGPQDYLRTEIRQNPTRFGLPPNPSQEEINRVVEQRTHLSPDQSIWEAYAEYMVGALQGDMGISVIVEPGAPVLDLILEAAPWTIFLSSVALVYGLIVGIVLGSLMAYYEGSKFDVGMTTSMILSSAVPYYLAAILLLYFLGFQLDWFPTEGRYDPDAEVGYNWAFVSSVFEHAALPILSIIVTSFGGGALGMRANSIRILGDEYVRGARLRGLSTYTISTRYLARNAILPLYTGIVIGLGGILGGSVILEEIFAYNGMGRLMFEATVARDFPLLTAGLIITSVLFVIGTLIADFTYALVDPRAEQSSMG